MHITRKTMYAIKAIIFIASVKEDRLSTISEISEFEKIPREYIAKILKELSDKGFLISYRGIHGGYKLRRSLAEITFLDILEAMQGRIDKEIRDDVTISLYKGPAFDFWNDLHDVVKDRFANMNLAKLDYDGYSDVKAGTKEHVQGS